MTIQIINMDGESLISSLLNHFYSRQNHFCCDTNNLSSYFGNHYFIVKSILFMIENELSYDVWHPIIGADDEHVSTHVCTVKADIKIFGIFLL